MRRRLYYSDHIQMVQQMKTSDVDLCVITREREKRKIEIIKELRRAIAPVLSYPVDLLVYDEEEFYERANATSSFEYKIKTKGVEVYEQ